MYSVQGAAAYTSFNVWMKIPFCVCTSTFSYLLGTALLYRCVYEYRCIIQMHVGVSNPGGGVRIYPHRDIVPVAKRDRRRGGKSFHQSTLDDSFKYPSARVPTAVAADKLLYFYQARLCGSSARACMYILPLTVDLDAQAYYCRNQQNDPTVKR